MTLEERVALVDQGIAEILAAVAVMQDSGNYTEAAAFGITGILGVLNLDKRISVIEDRLGIEFPEVPGFIDGEEETS